MLVYVVVQNQCMHAICRVHAICREDLLCREDPTEHVVNHSWTNTANRASISGSNKHRFACQTHGFMHTKHLSLLFIHGHFHCEKFFAPHYDVIRSLTHESNVPTVFLIYQRKQWCDILLFWAGKVEKGKIQKSAPNVSSTYNTNNITDNTVHKRTPYINYMP